MTAGLTGNFADQIQLADTDSMHSFGDAAPVQPDDNGHYPVAVPGSKAKIV